MYYPVMGAPSAVFDKYLKLLKEEYQFHIITLERELYLTPSKEYDLHYVTSYRNRLGMKCMYNIDHHRHFLVNKILYFFLRVCTAIQTQYAFPNSKKWEVDAYYNKMKELYITFHFDTIIAISDYYLSQLAARKFKKEYPSVKWILFATDPFSENYVYYNRKLFKPLWKWMNKRAEQKLYNDANYCMLTKELYSYVLNNYTIDKNKIATIHYSLSNRLAGRVFQHDNHSDCKLIFAGFVYKKIRNPEFALSVLSKVEGVHVDLFITEGECEDIINRYVSDKICREGFVSRDRYEKMIREEYDILLNIGNISSLQSPSKMLELLSTGKPIINFYYMEDTLYDMIGKYPLGLNIQNGDNGAIRKVEQFCKEMKGKMIPFTEVEKLYPENNIYKQAELLKSMIEA